MENQVENEEKTIYKKFWFWVIIILFLCISIYIYNDYNTIFSNYKRQSITILNQYKAGKLTRKETHDKIDTISNKLRNEQKINNETNFYDKINISTLETNLVTIAYELFDNELSNTEIDTYINEIKRIK